FPYTPLFRSVYVGLHVLGFGLSHFALVCVGLALVWLAVTLRLCDRYPIRAPRRIAVRRRTVTVGAATAVLAVTAFTLPLDDAGAGADGTQQPLFANHEPIAIVIEADLRSLCRGAGRECENVPATLIFTEEDGAERRVSGSIRARGKWRAEAANCSVPPLFVTILDTAAYAAVLGAHPPVLPLTTHCREKPSAYEQYVLREYLAYRLYNALTDKSLRVRLARVTYRDSRRRGRAVERYALFVEHFDALAARLGGAVVPPAEVRPTDFDPQSLAMFELFEYMIGNTDWSVVAGHNVVHIREPDG